LVPAGKIIPPKSMVLGVPGKIVREVTDEEVQATIRNALWYVELSKTLEK
jgi:Carbonic anhydrases/acetyltransferases, isoleucine patch superfamily